MTKLETLVLADAALDESETAFDKAARHEMVYSGGDTATMKKATHAANKVRIDALAAYDAAYEDYHNSLA